MEVSVVSAVSPAGCACAKDGIDSKSRLQQAGVDGQYVYLLFKALKQNLRIKTFIGTSANALQIQIWTALIAILLLKYLQLRARFGRSLSNLAALLRQQLFVCRDLWDWIHQPVQPPPILTDSAEHISFSWHGNLDSRTTTSTSRSKQTA
jgi:hypothetical protein